MAPISDRGKSDRYFRRNRLKALLALQGRTFGDLCDRVGVSQRHLALVLRRERRPSSALVEGLLREVGADPGRFLIGEIDFLVDPPESQAAPAFVARDRR